MSLTSPLIFRYASYVLKTKHIISKKKLFNSPIVKLSLGIASLIILLSGSIAATQLSEKPQDLRQQATVISPYEESVRCRKSGGSWTEFTNSCADLCSSQTQKRACLDVMTDSCDCGPSQCWNGNTCEVNNSKPTLPPIKVTPTPFIQPPITQCMWCGNQCIPYEAGVICPTVMPPEGFSCEYSKEYKICQTVPEPTTIPNPTSVPEPTEISICREAGGIWAGFTNSCADLCSAGDYCLDVMINGCDCGPSQCWNGNTCEANNPKPTSIPNPTTHPNPTVGPPTLPPPIPEDCEPKPPCMYPNDGPACLPLHNPGWCADADFDYDGDVDSNDYQFLIIKFFSLLTNFDTRRADLFKDGKINIKDYSVFVSQWTGSLPTTDNQ